MSTYRVHIDGALRYVRTTEAKLRVAMWEHIRTELAKGRSLASIEYCYVRVA